MAHLLTTAVAATYRHGLRAGEVADAAMLTAAAVPKDEAYNHQWLIERHGHRTPAEVRRQLTLQAA
jgi:hypothetical protein